MHDETLFSKEHNLIRLGPLTMAVTSVVVVGLRLTTQTETIDTDFNSIYVVF